MEIEVVGRHALLFDDDAMAAFVNSSDALVEWNSIPIDRYDVRHLLSSPPPPRRRHHHIVDSFESDLDQERYADLSYDQQETDDDDDMKPVDAGRYNAVAFSYGNNEESAVHKDSDPGLGSSSFCPPFPVPVDLVIPPTEKLHHIIARTAIYVSKHGAQSEIVLRVKQGDNPTFGFLMPDHHLHSYFRFLVDHPEVLHSDAGEKPQNDKISDTEPGAGGGALSLLGSLYGFGEDDDSAVEHALTSEEKASDGATAAQMSEKTVSPKSFSNVAVSNHSVNSQDKVAAKPKDKVFMLKRNSLTSGLKAGTGSGGGTRKEGESLGSHSATTDKLRSSSVPPTLMIEPPSEMKKMIAKIVEFIMKNGKQFEAVLIEQDSEHGRFPFLLPSSQYYQYYLKVLQEAQKSKVSGRASLNEKDSLGLHGSSKKTTVSKGSGSSTLETAECEIPFDSDRKEKFKMVIGKSKNDGLDPPAKASQQQSEVGVDAAAAAAILQAATRGIRTPNLDFLSRSSLNRKDNSSEHVSSLGSHPSSQPQSVAQKLDQDGARCSVPVVKENTKTAALEAAGEADSLEAHLTKEQKLKAERLRRAKMFVAMIKGGSATQIKPESSRGTSLEPSHAGGADAEDNRAVAAKERAGSSAPLEIDATENIESSTNKFSTDEYNERKARRKYRSNSGKHEAAKDDTDDEEYEAVQKHSRKKHRKEEKGVDDRDIKHSRKQHTSRASEEYVSEQEDQFEKYHRYSRKHHRSRRSSHERDEKDKVEHEDERDHKYSRKHHRSYKSSNDEDEDEDEDERKRHRSRRSSHDGDEKDEVEHDDERDHRYSRKHHRYYKSSNDEDEDEDERKRHRSRRSSHDGDEKDEVEHDDERDHRYSRKHHRSYKSSNDDDEEQHEDRCSRKKHRSHQSSHRSRHHSSRDSHGHKHRKRHTSSKDKESRRRSRHNITSEEENVHCIGSDGLNGKVARSEREDLEEGEISAKVSDQSRGSAGGVNREPSVDVSSSFQDQRSSSQPMESTEVSDDLRAKIRAMLLETL